MPTTSILALPYPALSSAPNIPQDLQLLAAQAEATLAGAYVSYTPTFYSNAVSGTAIAGGSVAITYAKYQQVNKRIHTMGHATINVTTASGFAVGLPVALSYRSFSLSRITLHGASTTYDLLLGDGHCPNTTGPFNRVSPVSRGNSFGDIAATGNTVHWNITYDAA